MPELPEVETMTRDLRALISAEYIESVEVLHPLVLRNTSQTEFKKLIEGFKVKSVQRFGKASCIELNDRWLVVQPMMTGHFSVYSNSGYIAPSKATKIRFLLSNRKLLHYNDIRMFGRVYVLKSPMELPYIQSLGPDPLTDKLMDRDFIAKLSKRSVPIKNLLLDPKFISGIGNIYASEILHLAGIHPERKSNALSNAEVRALLLATQSVIKEAVELRGTSMRDYQDASGEKGNFMQRIKVYGKSGSTCLKCKTEIQRSNQSGRSTFFCLCQC